jgi:general stress protein 26
MAQHDETAPDRAKVWAMMEKLGICMLSTRDGEEIRARPMAAHPVEDEDAVYFLTDAESHKDTEIAQNPHVGMAFADPAGHTYLSVTGRAVVSNDRAKIRELFSTPARPGGTAPTIPRSGCSRSSPTTPSTGTARAAR